MLPKLLAKLSDTFVLNHVVAEVDYVKTAMTQQAVSLEIDGEPAIK